MGFTTICIAISVSFVLWLLLLLLIISKLGALNNRISRLTTILGDFDKIEPGIGTGENTENKKPKKA